MGVAGAAPKIVCSMAELSLNPALHIATKLIQNLTVLWKSSLVRLNPLKYKNNSKTWQTLLNIMNNKKLKICIYEYVYVKFIKRYAISAINARKHVGGLKKLHKSETNTVKSMEDLELRLWASTYYFKSYKIYRSRHINISRFNLI